ncbi:gluconokinase [Amycolatopsis cihanbeyliensis]|uniref:Gluconokinase n=1 Tax=Amycolatopsis cihanbeyliensis TaxID=1128664 RepID=A0A542DPF6_AMYCI|nr:gluconokinase [Amycolatopsis cihanbeyliensis]TQJ04936.1 gluconokinase [Amycolatopsis cihanbeyliensis]
MSVIVVMGVAGSGKTTVGTELAAALGVEYAEADSFHPEANVAKMSAGTPLTDADRAPWLSAIAGWISEHAATGGVVSCSALKRSYRDVLRVDAGVWFLHLHGDRELLAGRMTGRSGHFMPVSLLDSQLADLEPLRPDEPGLTADIATPPEDIVRIALGRESEGTP